MVSFRVLHSLSFIDDPTRILRAVRYEQRLDFVLEPRTAELIADALPMMDRVTGDRIRHEIERALKEADPVRVMHRLYDLGVMRQIHPALRWTQETAVAYERVPEILQDPDWLAASGTDSPLFLYFALWLLPLQAGEKEAVMARLKVRKATRDDVVSARLSGYYRRWRWQSCRQSRNRARWCLRRGCAFSCLVHCWWFGSLSSNCAHG